MPLSSGRKIIAMEASTVISSMPCIASAKDMPWIMVSLKDIFSTLFRFVDSWNYSALQHINLILFPNEAYIDCEWKNGYTWDPPNRSLTPHEFPDA
ncbi:hypothetical protein GCM10027321_28590 [Massilia terrae]